MMITVKKYLQPEEIWANVVLKQTGSKEPLSLTSLLARLSSQDLKRHGLQIAYQNLEKTGYAPDVYHHKEGITIVAYHADATQGVSRDTFALFGFASVLPLARGSLEKFAHSLNASLAEVSQEEKGRFIPI